MIFKENNDLLYNILNSSCLSYRYKGGYPSGLKHFWSNNFFLLNSLYGVYFTSFAFYVFKNWVLYDRKYYKEKTFLRDGGRPVWGGTCLNY